jgi:hypothetical protein
MEQEGKRYVVWGGTLEPPCNSAIKITMLVQEHMVIFVFIHSFCRR